MKHLFHLAAPALLALSAIAPAGDVVPDPLGALVGTLSKIKDPKVQATILRGMNASLAGRHGIPEPKGWGELYASLHASPSDEVKQLSEALAVTFGDRAGTDAMRQTLANRAAPSAARQAALDALVAAHDPSLAPLLLEFLKEAGPLRAGAIRALAASDDPRVAPSLLEAFTTLDPAEQRDALNTLLVRPSSARLVLQSIDGGKMSRSAITAPLARQLQSLKDGPIDTWLEKNWGMVHTSSAEKQAQIARMKDFLAIDQILRADANRGRALFSQTCGVCHTIFGTGGKIGPELPGSFEDVDYLLQNIVDPNAIIGKDYQQTFVKLRDGQSVAGIIAGDDPNSVTLKTLGGEMVLQKSDIVELKVSDQSMMPEGLLTALDQQSVRDLFAYLRQRGQIPMLATPDNAAEFFDGTDLLRWKTSANAAAKVEGGEMILIAPPSGNAAVTSEMLARDYRLTAQVQVTGATAVAEVVINGGSSSTPFTGRSLSFGGTGSANLWDYSASPPRAQPLSATVAPQAWTPLEVVCGHGNLKVLLNGETVAELPAAKDATIPAIYLSGGGAELRIKDLKIEVPR